jgi:hypothetical protein
MAIQLTGSDVQTLVEFAGGAKAIGAALLSFAALMFACYRSKSSHVVMSRLLKLLLGVTTSRSTDGNSLNSFFNERGELIRFRIETGIRAVETHAQAVRLTRWASRFELDVEEIGKAGAYFDPYALKIKNPLPGMAAQFILSFGAVLLGYCVLVAVIALAVFPPAVKVVKSGNWYFATSSRASAIRWKSDSSAAISVGSCNGTVGPRTQSGIADEDVAPLCSLLTSDQGKEFLSRANMTQDSGLACVAFCLSILGAMLWKESSRMSAAVRLLRKIEDRALPTALEIKPTHDLDKVLSTDGSPLAHPRGDCGQAANSREAA